jgi:hypothetical protein
MFTARNGKYISTIKRGGFAGAACRVADKRFIALYRCSRSRYKSNLEISTIITEAESARSRTRIDKLPLRNEIEQINNDQMIYRSGIIAESLSSISRILPVQCQSLAF